MKLRKTRIKKITTANGVETFIPQIKTFFSLEWIDFTDYQCNHLRDFNFIIMSEHKLGCLQVCKSLKEAQDVIDAYITYVNRQNAISIENTVVKNKIIKTEYIDYPQEN